MTALLYKQFRLVCHPMTPIFCLFGVMVLIPNYPYTVIFFYVTLGLFFTFLNMREQKDIYYSALLPVPKRDTVKAGCLFTVLIEVLSLVLLVPFSVLAVHLQPGKDNLVGLDPNAALLAAGFLLYAVFNAVFLPSFYKNGYKVGVSYLKACVVMAVLMLVCEALPNFSGAGVAGRSGLGRPAAAAAPSYRQHPALRGRRGADVPGVGKGLRKSGSVSKKRPAGSPLLVRQ